MTVPQAIGLIIFVLIAALIPAVLAFPWEIAIPWFVWIWAMMVLFVIGTEKRQQ